MPTENEYTLQDLANLAGVTPRTIRYYIAQGLLPSPGRAGPGATYTDGHLNRLRLIRNLQRQHLPLAEIRAQLEALDDQTIAGLVGRSVAGPAVGSAVDYIRNLLGRETVAEWSMSRTLASPGPSLRRAIVAQVASMTFPDAGPPSPDAASPDDAELADAPTTPPAPDAPAAPTADTVPTAATTLSPATASTPDRSQWDRISLAPDVELHVRRPLTRRQHKQVERLIAIARELLEEDPS